MEEYRIVCKSGVRRMLTAEGEDTAVSYLHVTSAQLIDRFTDTSGVSRSACGWHDGVAEVVAWTIRARDGSHPA